MSFKELKGKLAPIFCSFQLFWLPESLLLHRSVTSRSLDVCRGRLVRALLIPGFQSKYTF